LTSDRSSKRHDMPFILAAELERLASENQIDTLTPINLIFLFPLRKGAISRLALFLIGCPSYFVGNNKDLDILLILIRLKEEQFNNNPISLGKG
jgi:hypothetical protein